MPHARLHHGSATAACADAPQSLHSANEHRAGLSTHEHAQMPWMTRDMSRGALQGHTLCDLLMGCLWHHGKYITASPYSGTCKSCKVMS